MPHHYLPETYLKGFTLDASRPRIVAFRAGSGASFEAAPRNVAAQHGLYRITPRPPVTEARCEAIENSISRLESGFAAARNRVVASGRIWSLEDFGYLISFAGLLRFRTPAAQEDANTFADALMKAHTTATICDTRKRQSFERFLAAKGKDPESSVELLRDFRRFRYGETQDGWVMEMLQRANVATDLFLQMHWRVERSDGQLRFITSDFPVTAAAPTNAGDTGQDLRDVSIELVFPLTRDHALIGTWHRMRDATVGPDRVDMLNRRTAWCAAQFVYADSKQTRYAEYARYFTGAPRVRVEGVPTLVDSDVAKKGRLLVKLHTLPVPWNPTLKAGVAESRPSSVGP